ncbi:MAG: glycoside hydrolase family 31 protein [Bacteroides sp.]|nr:glycoside hydrolase family 31 protein [Bacteroides sp.]
MKHCVLLALAMLLVMELKAQSGQTIEVTTQGQTCCKATFLSPTIVRITKIPVGKTWSMESMVVTMQPQANFKTVVKDEGEQMTLKSSELCVSIRKSDGRITFTTTTGTSLLMEKSFALDERTIGADRGAYIASQTFTLDADEPIYGLGILQDGKMNRRGTHRYMIQNNTEDYQNVIQSIKGWALYWDNYSPTDFNDNADGMTFRSDVADGIDYYLMYGKTVDGCVAEMRNLSGQVPMFPLWTFGFWQSKERYKSWAETTGVVHKYRELGIPLDGIVQDWQYWGSHYLWNAMEFLGDDFQNADAAIDDIHRNHAHLMITIWSSFGPHTKPYREMEAGGHLFDFQTWPQSGVNQWPPRMDYPSGVRCYDPFSSEARDIYWNNLRRLFDAGLDGWWMDSTEPDNFNWTESDFEHSVDGGKATMRRMRNAYPLACVSGVYTHQRAVSSDKRVFIMTRSGFAGQQRYGANVWSGDVGSSWETLRAQLPAGLNFTLTGNPNFNTDLGGFFAGAYNGSGPNGSAVNNPLYRELYTRWMQYGLFCPVFRSHGTEVPREVYLYGKPGEPIYDAMVSTIRLRYRLLPYLYSTAWQVTSASQSYMRPLMADFKDDRRTWDMGLEFMFGRSILAAPIVHAQYTPEKVVSVDAMSGWDKRESASEHIDLDKIDFAQIRSTTKYLPAGTGWYDFFSGQLYEGGQDVTLKTNIGSIPMFVRAGSILPLAEEMQYATEKPWDNLEIRVYPGADARFTLYEDEGDNYNYESGAYSTIDFTWNDKRHTLTIAARRGEYTGMLTTRTFRIVLPDGTERTVEYKGKKVVIKFS